MRALNLPLAIVTATATLLFPPNSQGVEALPWIWANFCGHLPDGAALQSAAYSVPGIFNNPPPVPCAAAPTGYHRLQQATAAADLSVDLSVSSDTAGTSLCYVYNGVPEAPVIRIQRGDTLTFRR